MSQLREEILRYLSCHPDARDSVEGIVSWWLPQQRRVDACVEIEAELEALVAQGVLEKVCVAGSLALYGRTKDAPPKSARRRGKARASVDREDTPPNKQARAIG